MLTFFTTTTTKQQITNIVLTALWSSAFLYASLRSVIITIINNQVQPRHETAFHSKTVTPTISQRVTGDGLAAEATHDKGLFRRLQCGVQLLPLPIKQCPEINKEKQPLDIRAGLELLFFLKYISTRFINWSLDQT